MHRDGGFGLAGGSPAQQWEYKREGEILGILFAGFPSHGFGENPWRPTFVAQVSSGVK